MAKRVDCAGAVITDVIDPVAVLLAWSGGWTRRGRWCPRRARGAATVFGDIDMQLRMATLTAESTSSSPPTLPRALEFDQLPHAIVHDLPEVLEDCLHRIGRTGRTGRSR